MRRINYNKGRETRQYQKIPEMRKKGKKRKYILINQADKEEKFVPNQEKSGHIKFDFPRTSKKARHELNRRESSEKGPLLKENIKKNGNTRRKSNELRTGGGIQRKNREVKVCLKQDRKADRILEPRGELTLDEGSDRRVLQEGKKGRGGKLGTESSW